MSLSAAQLSTLKADIAANASTVLIGGVATQIKNVTLTNDTYPIVAAWYNLAVAPAYWAWKSFVPDQDIYSVITADGTAWSWTVYIGRSQGERDAWRQMVNMAGGLNPSLANVRTGVADIFSGAGGAAQRTHLLTIGRRPCTNGERLSVAATAGGVGARGSTANPDTLGFEGNITADNIENSKSAA